MTDTQAVKGPWFQRFLIYFFSFLFGLLIYWLLGFVLHDIGTWPGPSYQELEQEMLDQDLVAEAKRLEEELRETTRRMEAERARQAILRNSTSSSQQTMNQLLEIQRLSLEQGRELSEAEQNALTESEELFLSNQREFQRLNEQIAQLNEQIDTLQRRQRTVQRDLEEQREPVNERYQELLEWHNWQLAGLKLLVLLPLVVVGGLLFQRHRRSLYAPLIYAFCIAVAVRLLLVLHEHFPARYFKYILILAALVIVVWILIHLLRAMAYPGRQWLLKQYREAYERFFCPICEYPIRRGPLRYLFWTRRSLKKQAYPPDSAVLVDEPYCCPSCGTRLFEECEVCHKTRHSLLPACEKCGSEKPLPAATPETK